MGEIGGDVEEIGEDVEEIGEDMEEVARRRRRGERKNLGTFTEHLDET